MKSIEIADTKKAIKELKKMKTLDELAAFTEGETREEIQVAAEKRMEKLGEGAEEEGIAPLAGRTWIYHEDHAPKQIEGAQWPEYAAAGWQLNQLGFEQPWKLNDRDGSFSK